jgi:hypothetical protein
MRPRPLARVWALLAVAAAGTVAGGCTTDAYCFTDCPGDSGASGTGASGGAGQGGDLFGGTGGCEDLLGCDESGGGGQGGGCSPSNGGIEKCDGADNDCNGAVDDGPDIDLASLKTCGTCETNCLVELSGCTTEGAQCLPSSNPGVEPGTCACSDCKDDYYDLDGDGKSCEYYCDLDQSDDPTEELCNNLDDDCDGTKDENVDLCSTTTCGFCGNNCVVLHGTAECDSNGQMPCDASNAQCAIAACDDDDADGKADWWDLDGQYLTGCEYQCALTNNGIEKCGDGLDNDCDGAIDSQDSDLSGDPTIGVGCFGDPDGLCATAAHAGITECVGNQVECGGANVLHDNDVLETCNAVDDDCDGIVDDSPIDIGDSCGISNVFPCSFGTFQCQSGALVCIGAVNPGVEACNGVDDDCDGNIDKTGVTPPADAVGACNVPPPPPANATSPCKAGTKACVGGTIQCTGSVGPTSTGDTCAVDANCDGQLTNQPNLQTDVANCGSCGNNCLTGAVHANWACVAGGCAFQGCQPGYYDLNNDNKCEYPCVFIQAQENCNGVDDNCNGTIDENVSAPSPVQVCGVSPSATGNECKSTTQGGQVGVACQSGAWKCTFPSGVCSPTCAGATEICDALDNDCDGGINENVSNYGQPCASDAASPGSQGACKTTGTYVCNGPNATVCNAMASSCAALPGGCAELCDGIDNDCDGAIDETFNSKGANATYFVKPNVTRISGTRWIYSYEASRPTATNVVPGQGNGYRCVNGSDPVNGTCTFTVGATTYTAPSAPAATTLDKTTSCSLPDKLPWFNVTPAEVEAVCQSVGGFICSSGTATSDWRTACEATNTCKWGYYPRIDSFDLGTTPDCQQAYTSSRFCNLGPSFDFSSASGDQDGLLPTKSPLLGSCWADWSGLQNNATADNKIYDITGNLREIGKSGSTYRLLGGAFNTQSTSGAECSFEFYTVEKDFKFYDTGFRCCFAADPRL